MPFARELVLFGVICAILLGAAVAIARLDIIVRHKSGLNSTDTLRRMWAKPELVLLARARFPLALCFIAALGTHNAVVTILFTLLELVGVVTLETHFVALAVFGSALAVSALAATCLYRVAGGDSKGAVCAVLVANGLFGLVALSLNSQVLAFLSAVPVFGALFLVLSLGLGPAVAQWTWALRIPHPSPPAQFLVPWKTLLLYTPLLLLVLACTVVLEDKLPSTRGAPHDPETGVPTPHYLARVVLRLAQTARLVACAFVSITCTNTLVMDQTYGWLWPSALVPAVPLVLGHVGVVVLSVFIPFKSPAVLAAESLGVFGYAAAGILGSFAYLCVVARYAQKALDPGVEGQAELMEEDDDEFEI